MIYLTEGCARAWEGVHIASSFQNGANFDTLVESDGVSMRPPQGEGRARPGDAGPNVWTGETLR
jgi:hypothetical protein